MGWTWQRWAWKPTPSSPTAKAKQYLYAGKAQALTLGLFHLPDNSDRFRFCRKVSRCFSIALNLPYVCQNPKQDTLNMSIDFKGSQHPKDVILYAVFRLTMRR